MSIHLMRFWLLSVVCGFCGAAAMAQSSNAFHNVLRIDGVGTGERRSSGAEVIQAFDVSPDGSLLAVYFQSATARDSGRILIEDVVTGKTLAELKLANDAGFQDLPPWYVPHLEFSTDQRFLVIQDCGSIRVVKLSSFEVVKTFGSTSKELSVPFSILSASTNDLFLFSYGKAGRFTISGFNDLTNPHVHNELVNISTGQLQSSWESMDIPQSLSPDGKLAAVSDWDASDILVEIEIVSTETGQRLKTLRSGYKFGKPWEKVQTGRVIGKFLSDDEILLSPDEHVDRNGHKSGRTIRIMRVSDGQLLREISLANFGPMGEVVLSADRDCAAILNWYISPGDAKHDRMPSEESRPELIVFPDLSKLRSYAISQLSLDGLMTNQYLGTAYQPRISNHALVVAVAQHGGVTVFRKN